MIALLILSALGAYFISSLNPAIIFSKLVYHKDIREIGSGNAGFSNFKREFGMKLAWLVFLLDISKAIVIEFLCAYLFKRILGEDFRDLGVAYSGIFCMLGHSYPVWYKFKGGKGFLVCITTLFILDWRVGLIGFGVLCLFLFTFHYMSLATILAMFTSAVVLYFMNPDLIANIMFSACTLFMIAKHHENIKRLFTHCEKKFYFTKKS